MPAYLTGLFESNDPAGPLLVNTAVLKKSNLASCSDVNFILARPVPLECQLLIVFRNHHLDFLPFLSKVIDQK